MDKNAEEHRTKPGDLPLIIAELGLYANSALGIENTSSNPAFRTSIDWHRGMCRAIKICVMCRAVGVEALIPRVPALFGGSLEKFAIWHCLDGMQDHPARVVREVTIRKLLPS